VALIWETEQDEVRYEVRRAGQTLRLFANGVQHSEFHPKRLLTGSVWDLLWLPALLHEPARFRRVLMAVELDGVHLQVAREVFGIDAFGVETWQGDAQQWLREYQGEPFDLIIEDLFAPSNEQVSRAVPADAGWQACLRNNLSEHGTLVMNFGDWQEYRDSSASGRRAMKSFASRFRLSCSDCHNAVIAFTREPARSIHLRRRIAVTPALSHAKAAARLDYHIRQLD
jgi:spermidine synthase